MQYHSCLIRIRRFRPPDFSPPLDFSSPRIFRPQHENGCYEDFSPPRIFCPPTENKKSYKKLFEKLKEDLNKVGPTYYSCDFEITVMVTVTEVFPETDICGCLFHFSQSLFHVLKKNGLQSKYIDNEEDGLRSDFHVGTPASFGPLEQPLHCGNQASR